MIDVLKKNMTGTLDDTMGVVELSYLWGLFRRVKSERTMYFLVITLVIKVDSLCCEWGKGIDIETKL